MYLVARIIAYAVVAYLCIKEQKTLLDNIDIDGFTYQILYIRGLVDIGINISNLEPLLIVHYFRFLVAYPIDYIDHSNYNFLTPIVILLIIEPLIKIFKTRQGKYFFLLLIVLPIFMSYRNILVIAGIGYLVYYIKINKNPAYLLFSALLVNLSSGSVLVAIVCSLIFCRVYRVMDLRIIFYTIFLSISLLISLTDKYMGFSLGESGYAATEYGATGIFAIITRSTIYVSVITGNYFRAAIYFLVGVSALFSIIFASRHAHYRGYAVIFIASLPVFLVEGLGVIALIIPILLFLSADKLPFRLRAVALGQPGREALPNAATQR